jgi:hypothetical protein
MRFSFQSPTALFARIVNSRLNLVNLLRLKRNLVAAILTRSDNPILNLSESPLILEAFTASSH